MFILSQDKTRIFNTSGHIEEIGYKEENFKEGKKEEIRHTIQVFGGCAEEIAEYKCNRDSLRDMRSLKEEYRSQTHHEHDSGCGGQICSRASSEQEVQSGAGHRMGHSG